MDSEWVEGTASEELVLRVGEEVKLLTAPRAADERAMVATDVITHLLLLTLPMLACSNDNSQEYFGVGLGNSNLWVERMRLGFEIAAPQIDRRAAAMVLE